MTAYGVVLLAVKDQDVSPGVLGFLVVALLGVATWLLLRSMNRQIRRIDLPGDRDDKDDTGDVGDTGDTDDRNRANNWSHDASDDPDGADQHPDDRR